MTTSTSGTAGPAGTAGPQSLPTPATQAESMAQLRAQLDPLIAQLGTAPEVKTDDVIPCGASNGSDGWAATYAVWLTPVDGAQQTVETSVVPDLTDQGWRVTHTTTAENGGEVDWGFHRAHLDFGVTFHPSRDNLVIMGSGACLPEKE